MTDPSPHIRGEAVEPRCPALERPARRSLYVRADTPAPAAGEGSRADRAAAALVLGSQRPPAVDTSAIAAHFRSRGGSQRRCRLRPSRRAVAPCRGADPDRRSQHAQRPHERRICHTAGPHRRRGNEPCPGSTPLTERELRPHRPRGPPRLPPRRQHRAAPVRHPTSAPHPTRPLRRRQRPQNRRPHRPHPTHRPPPTTGPPTRRPDQGPPRGPPAPATSAISIDTVGKLGLKLQLGLDDADIDQAGQTGGELTIPGIHGYGTPR
ncbi:hypothetical protein SAMN04487981_14125 [Streptomyces sp. cf386]|nr:hypothetical protein SAMN04487981_14125 [Streptomyces sp. cf386]